MAACPRERGQGIGIYFLIPKNHQEIQELPPPTTPTARTFCPLYMIFPYVREVREVRGDFFFKKMTVSGVF
jgi:hypothetical protein